VSLGSQPLVGLDVGTSAVRAARVGTSRGGSSLIKFGQIPLPEGAVVDGQIQDRDVVAETIERLWKRSKIGSDKVVIGLANHRVVVRQVELPYLTEKELRESIRFQAADHVPMPADEAEFDFEILDERTSADGERRMNVVLVAAATDMVEEFVQTIQSAGLDVVGVDLSPFAMARAVSPEARGEFGGLGAQAIVDVGAGVTDIIIHVGGEPRFVRILLVGGNSITNALSRDLNLTIDEAEALKFDLSGGVDVSAAYDIVAREVDFLVEEIRGSIDYYTTREKGEPVQSVLLTGGASLSQGLLQKLQLALGAKVQFATPLEGIKTKLPSHQKEALEPMIGTAIGLSMWENVR
jgi:type IV pilus assembly protein PilM